MNSTFKRLPPEDRKVIRVPLYEAVPISGDILHDQYTTNGAAPNEDNIKKYAHKRWEDVYDYPYNLSSANKLFSLSAGVSKNTGYTITLAESIKNQNYYLMAQTHAGYDENGDILDFDQDGDFAAGGYKITEPIFMKFSNLLYKDEIRKETFSLVVELHTAGGQKTLTMQDTNAATNYRTNSPAGDYSILYAVPTATSDAQHTADVPCGLIYYKTGLVVIDSKVFQGGLPYNGTTNLEPFATQSTAWLYATSGGQGFSEASFEGGDIENIADSFRERVVSVQFNNTTELFSNVYFVRIDANSFNYSSNPTYTQDSKIRVKRQATDPPVAFATGVGLYSEDNELLAVAKLSEPIQVDSTNEKLFKIRLDF